MNATLTEVKDGEISKEKKSEEPRVVDANK